MASPYRRRRKPKAPSARVVEVNGQRFLLHPDHTCELLPEEPKAPKAPRRRGRRKRTGSGVSTKSVQATDYHTLYAKMPHDEAIKLPEVEWKRWIAVQEGAPNSYVNCIS